MATATATLDYGYYGGLLSIGSELEEEIRERYTEGECYLLALALHSLGLGELVAVVDGTAPLDDRTSWTHMALRTPEGYILDADGLNEPGITLQNYGWDLPESGAIASIDLPSYETLIHGQADSIFTMEDTLKVALELQAWLAKIPPLKPLGH